MTPSTSGTAVARTTTSPPRRTRRQPLLLELREARILRIPLIQDIRTTQHQINTAMNRELRTRIHQAVPFIAIGILRILPVITHTLEIRAHETTAHELRRHTCAYVRKYARRNRDLIIGVIDVETRLPLLVGMLCA